MKIALRHIIALIVFTSIIFATDTKEKTANNPDDYYIDFAIPDLSAFSLLNTKPVTSSSPGYLKEFAFQLSQPTSDAARVPLGFAFQWSPFYRVGKFEIKSITGYSFSRMLQGIQFTAGANKNAFGSNVALGLKFIIFDESDPILNNKFLKNMSKLLSESFNYDVITQMDNFKDDKRNKLRNKLVEIYTKNLKDEDVRPIKDSITNILYLNLRTDLQKAPDSLYYKIVREIKNKVDSQFEEKTELLTELDNLVEMYYELINFASTKSIRFDYQDSVKKLRLEYEKNNWNKFGLSVAGGWMLTSGNDSWKMLNGRKLAWIANIMLPSTMFWDNGPTGFGASLIGYCQQNFYSKATNDITSSDISFGGRLLLGKNTNRFSIDVLYTNYINIKKPKSNAMRFTGGYEFKISDGIWLEIILGSDKENNSEKSKIVTLTNFKYSINPKPRF